MSLEINRRTENTGDYVMGLLQEVQAAGIRAQQARQQFKEITSTADAILGAEGSSFEEKERVLGRIVLEKGLAEAASKETRARNMSIINGLLAPKDAERPLVTVTNLSGNAITRSFNSNKIDPTERLDSITGTVDHVGDYSMSIRGADDVYLVYPTHFTTAEPQVRLDILPSADERAA